MFVTKFTQEDMERNTKCYIWLVTIMFETDISEEMAFVNKADAIEKADKLAKPEEYDCKKIYEDEKEIKYYDNYHTFITIKKILLY